MIADIAERVERAIAEVDSERLAQLCCALVDVASPTGDEAPLAAVIAELLTQAGASGSVQPIDERQANAWGALRASPLATGSTLMLYAPIDTVTTGDSNRDIPHAASEMVGHLRARSVMTDGRITGLGAMNPKGHAACIIGAVEAISRSGIELDGDLIAAFGAGGMPTNGLEDADGVIRRHHVGHGVGCSFLLEQGVWADAAVIAKSGWAVSYEEVGLAWFEITVRGTHTYVGSRHLLPYRNAVADAATVVLYLERWFAARASERTINSVAPQGIVAGIEGGWQRTSAFAPASARVRVDLRLTPAESPLDGFRELRSALDQLVAEDPEIDLDVRMTASIPGSRTDPEHWIHRAAVSAWERQTDESHVATRATSGATDANILRNRGIPTVRVGLPKSFNLGGPLDFGAGMNTVDIEALVVLTRYLVRLSIEATAHPRSSATLSSA